MCIISATAAAIATAVVGIASTAIGVVSSIQQGKAQEAQYEYQAQVQRDNERIANQNATMERQAGIEEARRQRIKTLQMVGAQKSALAANGVDIGVGTSLDTIEDTAMMGELDALMIEKEAETRARNFDIQANNFSNEANLSMYSARNARSAGTLNALSSAANGIGNTLTSLSNYGGFGNLKSSTFSGLGTKIKNWASDTSLGTAVINWNRNRQGLTRGGFTTSSDLNS